MGKILIFIYEGMADFEITFVTNLLGVNLGKEIITIGYENELIKSKSGIEYKPSKLVKDVLEYDIEGLIIPGGNNVEVRAEIINLIRDINDTTLDRVQKAVALFVETPGMTLKQLSDMLPFKDSRAILIASTEVSNILPF